MHPGSKVAPGASQADVKGKYRAVPEPEERPAITEVIEDIEKQAWYQEQIAYRRVFEAREGQSGTIDCTSVLSYAR